METDPVLCRIDELEKKPAQKSARGIDLTIEQKRVALILLELDGDAKAYLNRCPHTGVELNWNPHQFFDVQGEFLQCSLHGALFRPEDGYCIRGPCAGQSLHPLETYVDGPDLRVKIDARALEWL